MIKLIFINMLTFWIANYFCSFEVKSEKTSTFPHQLTHRLKMTSHLHWANSWKNLWRLSEKVGRLSFSDLGLMIFIHANTCYRSKIWIRGLLSKDVVFVSFRLYSSLAKKWSVLVAFLFLHTNEYVERKDRYFGFALVDLCLIFSFVRVIFLSMKIYHGGFQYVVDLSFSLCRSVLLYESRGRSHVSTGNE